MSERFQYDVFLSHHSEDKPRVRRLAECLRHAGLRVWFDEWSIQSGDIIALKVDEGLERSRVLLLCISPAALASRWVALERSTALHRDPANEDRRFIPLLLSDCELPGTLRRYKYFDFREETEVAFAELLALCKGGSPEAKPASPTQHPPELIAQLAAWLRKACPVHLRCEVLMRASCLGATGGLLVQARRGEWEPLLWKVNETPGRVDELLRGIQPSGGTGD